MATVGELRVRVSFNPSKSDAVMQLKQEFARLIDRLEELKKTSPDPQLCAVAQTAIEEAAMWAVKAATAE